MAAIPRIAEVVGAIVWQEHTLRTVAFTPLEPIDFDGPPDSPPSNTSTPESFVRRQQAIIDGLPLEDPMSLRFAVRDYPGSFFRNSIAHSLVDSQYNPYLRCVYS
ncbi:hypothetical protein E2P81_ATG00607 [Venturia nashicola]|nr:hypothetical protein E2P81_ATG00607 [Venturia nashicola]